MALTRPKRLKKVGKKEQLARLKREAAQERAVVERERKKAEERASRRNVQLPEAVSVKDLALLLSVSPSEVISVLMKNGLLATINQRLDFETAAIVASELGFQPEAQSGETVDRKTDDLTDTREMKPRPPVVTVMGHVDHGKTSLLDWIRQTDVASTESGKITQHIGAYQVHVDRTGRRSGKVKGALKTITFVDTPGHEAFTAMRAHGASITDIVVLVVSATEGVLSQTLEARDHARAASVPVIVAITKIDLPEANVNRVKQELAQNNLLLEGFGGDIPFVEVSSKTGQGIDRLLELILAVAELRDLRAPEIGLATGVIIESHLQSGAGPEATALVRRGTLKTGDFIVAGRSFGRIRRMEDDRASEIHEAKPGQPVKILGLRSISVSGQSFSQVESEREARSLARGSFQNFGQTLSLASISKLVSGRPLNLLPIVLKADAVGSLQAARKVLEQIGNREVSVSIIHQAVGQVSESDVLLAKASRAIVIGFHVGLSPIVRKIADKEGVEIFRTELVYEIEDKIKAVLTLRLRPEEIEIELGRAEVLATFKGGGPGRRLYGAKVKAGRIGLNSEVRLERAGETIARAKILSLRRGNEEARSVEVGQEFGFTVDKSHRIEVGDQIREVKTETKERTLETLEKVGREEEDSVQKGRA